jgi:hypothetical protein
MVVIIIGHFRIAERSIISQGPAFFELYFFGPAKMRVDDVDLAPVPEEGQAQVEYLF